jgi:glycine/D-amino acid oxidase-like deaminating enzyme
MPARRGRQPKARGSEPTWTPRAMRSLAEAEPSVFWLDDPAAPPVLPSLVGAVDADLVVVGGGYTGLWTALQAKEADPGRDVILVEAATVGWEGRQGLADLGNQFHYYRLTADNRILWGGYDVIYHFGNRIRAEQDQRLATHAALAEQFFTTFPQLEGLHFTHRWGGVIDTCSRFTTFWGRAYRDRLAYAVGYTGLGVGASRFGARVMLDLLDGADNERTRLTVVRTKPIPFPPEPFRYGGIQLTRWSIDHADRNGGNRNLWLRTLDRMGLGFES